VISRPGEAPGKLAIRIIHQSWIATPGIITPAAAA